MSKKGTKALASATLMSLVLTTALSAGPVKAAQGSVTRIGAADRYATAAQVATQNWKDGAKDVVLVSGEGYADAVSASALAKQLNAPILLTTAGSLNADAKAALETLKPTNVYVVGGNASVSASVRSDLKAKYTLVELQGANRYETNVAVAKKLVELGVKADNVLLVGGEGFSDALSVAPVAAAKGQILLLGNNNEDSMKSVIDFVKANSSKVTVVGTSNVISDAIYSAVGAVDRVNGGASRFETNINVLNKFAADLKADKLFVANASGNGYADALVASALAGKTASPLVLVDTDGTTATTNAIDYIKGKATKTTDLNVVGGTGVVSDSIVGLINNAVNPTTPVTDGTVSAVSALNLNQIKVEYNQEVDEDTAEDVTNYKVDGSALTASNAKAVLQDDNKTVIITLATPEKQYDEVDVTVKKGILTADKSVTIPEFTQSVTFSDTTVPTLKAVTVQGNNKLTVEFSEAVNMTGTTVNAIKSKFQINGQNIQSFGLDQTYSSIDDNVTTGGGAVWSSKVEFYFDSPLPSGNNTLKVSDGDQGSLLTDAAGFTFKEASMDFSVDTLTTKPAIKSIEAKDDGHIYINFDRAMDKKTALSLAYYRLNGDNNKLSGTTTAGITYSASNIEFKENDTQVKISGVTGLNKGSNTLYVTNDVKDAYGNKVEDDTRKSFDLVEDDTKPTVTSVTIIDSKTIRVRFSKDVKASYAKNVSNYKLKDKDGADITGHILNVTMPGDTAGTKTSGDTYDVHINPNPPAGADWRLTSANYTLTIKNIVDTASTPNTMDDYTATLSGSDDVAPYVTNIVNKKTTISDSAAPHKAVVFFSEEMDSSSITNVSNYKYKNNSGDVKALPSGTTITVSSDNKSVTIKFPDSYYVWDNIAGDIPSADPDNIVKQITVANVKDSAGNALDTVADSKDIAKYSTVAGATIDSTSFKLYYDGDNLKADVKFSKSIDNLEVSDFKLAGVQPDSAYVNGDKVTLVWNDDSYTYASGNSITYNYDSSKTETNTTPEAISVIKNAGLNAVLTIAPSATAATTDVSGAPIASTTDITAYTSSLKVYSYQAAPKTTSDNWVVESTATSGSTTYAAIKLTFDTPLDQNSGIKVDDFAFTASNGTNLEAYDVTISGNTVTFRFDATKRDGSNTPYSTYFTASNTINIRAKSTAAIRTQKDADGNYATYTPSSDDLKDRAYTVDTFSPQSH